MRWRFVDRINAFEPWQLIAGCKTVSLEEYLLLKPFGRQGAFPESLVLECCVEIVRWLVATSSHFSTTCIPTGVDDFYLVEEIGMGARLQIGAQVLRRSEKELAVDCRVDDGHHEVAHGTIGFALLPIEEGFDKEWVEGMWRELHGAT